MAENQPHVPSPAEMLEPWRQMAERFEGQWNSYFNQMMGTDQFTNLLSTYTQGLLNMQQSIAQNVDRSFQALNLPARTDLTALAERLGALEAQIAGLSAEQRRLAEALESANGRKSS